MLKAVSYSAQSCVYATPQLDPEREAAHGLGPGHRPRRRHRRRHRRQQPRRTTWPGSAGRDIVQIDKGPLPNPGGSTGHASNFIFPVDHSREITDLTLDSRASSTRRWASSPSPAASRSRAPRSGWRSCAGGCRRPRRGASSPSWSRPAVRGREGAVPRPRPDHRRVLDARRSASSTRCAPARSCASGRMESGALTVVPTVEVTGLDVEDGRDPAGPHQRRRHRGRDRRHRLRRVEPEDRRHGRASASR